MELYFFPRGFVQTAIVFPTLETKLHPRFYHKLVEPLISAPRCLLQSVQRFVEFTDFVRFLGSPIRTVKLRLVSAYRIIVVVLEDPFT